MKVADAVRNAEKDFPQLIRAKRNVLRGMPHRVGEVPETLRKYIESTDKMEHN